MSRIGAKAKRAKEQQKFYEEQLLRVSKMTEGSLEDEIESLETYLSGLPTDLLNGPFGDTCKARLANLKKELGEGDDDEESKAVEKVSGTDLRSLMFSAFALAVIWFAVSFLLWKCT